MKCPKCVKESKKSTVNVGMTTRTLMAVAHYFDEDGKEVWNDPNKTTTHYNCSNGHQWSETK